MIPRRTTPIEKIGQMLKFDKELHRYFLNGIKIISVTKLVGNYKKKFDPDGKILAACARRKGISKLAMQLEWDKKKNDACQRGTNFHAEIEKYINGEKGIEPEIQESIKRLPHSVNRPQMFSECKLCSVKYAVAGTSDLVQLFSDKSVIVLDWKTNGKFETPETQRYRDKMLYPINHLGDSSLEVYSLQLWLYSLMLEEFGYSIRHNPIILWLNPENKIQQFECLNLKAEALRIMQHHFESRNNVS